MLQDDRKQYKLGKVVSKVLGKGTQVKEIKKLEKEIIEAKKDKDNNLKKLKKLNEQNASKEKIDDQLQDMVDDDSYIKELESILKDAEEFPNIEIGSFISDEKRILMRKQNNMGGMLEDDRQQYKLGKIVAKVLGKSTHAKEIKKLEKELDEDLAGYRALQDYYEQEVKAAKKAGATKEKLNDIDMKYEQIFRLQDGNIEILSGELEELGVTPTIRNLKERQRPSPREGGDFDEPMEALNQGGMLADDREQYSVGGSITKLVGRLTKKHQKKIVKENPMMDDLEAAQSQLDFFDYEQARRMVLDGDMTIKEAKINLEAVGYDMVDIQEFTKALEKSQPKVSLGSDLQEAAKTSRADRVHNKPMTDEEIDKALDNLRDEFAEGGALLADDMPMEETHMMPDGTEMPGATHEEMEPDTVMEDDYLEFVLDEALTPEEQSFLTQELEQNTQLAMVFDKVIDVAQEFAGSGPVEGPGSGVSDSIPARLSDGEFVFTAKAVDQIGADKLMAMMKDAEMKADDRQDLAEGGQPEEETVEMPVEKPATKQDIRVVKTTVDNGGKGLLDEDEISKSIKSKMMLDNRTGRHIQS